MTDVAGKVAFITGGGSGVGFGQASIFADAGCRVAIADIRQDHLDEATEYLASKGHDVMPILLDITDRDAYRRAADEVEASLGPVQLLFNTAGVSIFGPLQNATFEDWEWQLDVNLWGMINGIQIFVPRMLERGDDCHIINTSSMSAFVSLPGTGIYATTKMAVRGLSECLSMDLASSKIRVSMLCPGAVNTNIHEAVLTRPKHLEKTGYYGAELEFMWRPVDNLTISGIYGYTNFDGDEFSDGTLVGLPPGVSYVSDRPTYVPEDNWNLSASYVAQLSGGATLTPRIDIYGQSEICPSTTFSNSNPTITDADRCTAAFELMNVAVEWASQDREWLITVGGTNVTDEEYYLNKFDLTGFGQPTIEGQPGRPAEWFVTLQRNFQ